VLASTLEQKVAQLYAGLNISEEGLLAVRDDFRREIEKRQEKSGPTVARAKRQMKELELQRRRVTRGVVDGTVPPDLAREEQDRIARQRSECERTIATADQGFEVFEKPFQLVMQLLDNCEQLHVRGDAISRRMMNQVFFERLLVRQGEVAEAELKDPWYTIRQHGQSQLSGKSSNKNHLAPPTGFEPVLPP
jgi:hypothetical protein